MIAAATAAKAAAFVFGVVLFFWLPHDAADYSDLQRWGILFWYPTVAGMIGVSSALKIEPFFGLPIHWWLRGLFLGGWLHLILVIFAANSMSNWTILIKLSDYALFSPFWFVIDGLIVGCILAFIAEKAENWPSKSTRSKF